MRNKVFAAQFARKELSESSRRRTSLSPRVDPCPLPTLARPALNSHSTFLSPISSSALYVCIWSYECITVCALARVMYSYSTALRVVRRLQEADWRHSTSSLPSRLSLSCPWILFLFPLANSYQFFVRLRLARLSARLHGTDENGSWVSQKFVCTSWTIRL